MSVRMGERLRYSQDLPDELAQHTVPPLLLQPQVLFLDIRMPGQSGLEAAAELADEWSADVPFPIIVFITAYDQYALAAFEAQAVDHLLKPVRADRPARTVQRVQVLLLASSHGMTTPSLRVIQASVGQHIRLIPVDEVIVLEAADKYARVLTADSELLIRTPLKDLLPQLDTEVFWQIHRSTVVRASAIHSVRRDKADKLHLQWRQRPEQWPVSRLYAPRFKAM